MALNPALVNPTKDHPLYGKYTKTAMINKIVKLAVLAVVIIYLITVFYAPVFTVSTTVKNADETVVVYDKSVSYTMSEVLDEQEKFNDEEQYFEDVEDSVKYLKEKDFSELERIKNLEKANTKINAFFNTSNYVANTLGEMSEKYPYEYIALAEKANAIDGYTQNKDGETIPQINYQRVASYVTKIEQNKIAMLSKVFPEELEARNTDGLREFLTCVEKDAVAIAYATAGYTPEYAAELNTLADKYLVGEYTFDELFCTTLNEIADVNQFIPDSAMTKNIAEAIALYSDMGAFANYAAKNSELYKSQYIYFEYDLDTNEVVYEQHNSIQYINLVVNIMKWGVIAAIAIAVIAMIPTVIGLITRKHKKLRSFAFLYAGLPLLGLVLASIARNASMFASQLDLIDVICDVGNANSNAALVIVLILVASIVTKVLVTVYTSKYNKWLKEVRANAQTANAEAPVAEATVAEETKKEENN